MDMVDIVDADDRVIGRTTRDAAHSQHLLHRFVQVFVIDPGQRILVQRRSAAKKLGPLLFDASVGAHVDAGETYDQAVRREAVEELGLPAGGSFELLGTVHHRTPPAENMIGRLYLHFSSGPFSGWETEAERIDWLTPAELEFMTLRFGYLFTAGMLSSSDLYLRRVGVRG
jgi:isopentenyldiphosphate isomerase